MPVVLVHANLACTAALLVGVHANLACIEVGLHRIHRDSMHAKLACTPANRGATEMYKKHNVDDVANNTIKCLFRRTDGQLLQINMVC
jgi:hypothetical protein